MPSDQDSTRVERAVRRYGYSALFAAGVALLGLWLASNWLPISMGNDIAIHGLILVIFADKLMEISSKGT